MADWPIRTAVLAREGAARDRIVEGLQATGMEVAGVLDPAQVGPGALVELAPTAIIVSLEPALEDALEQYVEVFGDPAVTVIFEEAALVLDRTGWDAARWLRHLSAKLRRDRDVLPPGPAAGDDQAGTGVPVFDVDPAALALALDDGDASPANTAGALTVEGADGSDAAAFHAFDPVAFEHGDEGDGGAPAQAIVLDPALTAGLDLATDADPSAAAEADASTGVDFDFSGWSVEVPVETDAAAQADDDGLATVAPHAVEPGASEPDATDLDGASTVAAAEDAPVATLDAEALPSFVAASAPESASNAAAPNTPAKVDLAALESRISGLSLVDADSYGQGPQHGAVLVEGGLGGPDAVRQLLAAIPPGFPRPVLVRLQLDGGRYDRLVRQMERAAQLPVSLAEAGNAIADGEIHFVTPDLDIARQAGALRFVAADGAGSLPEALPADDSAVLFLSGSNPALVEEAMAPAWQGALVAGQSPEGCYDATAASAAIERGSASGTPAELASILAARWMPAAHAPSLDTGELSP